MQRLNFIIIPLFFLFASCSKQKPKGILSEKEMTGLMAEVALIDAYLNTLPIDSGRKVMPVLYANAFEKFKLDSAKFLQNLDYYLGSPVLTEKIYTDINKILTDKDQVYHREDSVRNIVVQDSIQRVMRLQRYTDMMRNMVMNVHRDSSEYNYVQYGADFLSKAELQVNAYGIQVPAVPQPVPDQSRTPQTEALQPIEERVNPMVSPKLLDTSKVKEVLRNSTN